MAVTSQGIFSGSNKLSAKDLLDATSPTNTFLTAFIGHDYPTLYGVFIRHLQLPELFCNLCMSCASVNTQKVLLYLAYSFSDDTAVLCTYC